MIRYNLICERRHEFESWFPSSAAYDKQAKRGLVACPACGATKVDKAIMAPSLAPRRRGRADKPIDMPQPSAPPAAAPEPSTPVAMITPQEQEVRAKLKELRDHIVKNADNVGDHFPNEARKMHYGEIEHRPIYGEASPEEAKSLIDEGVEVSPLPVLPEDRN